MRFVFLFVFLLTFSQSLNAQKYNPVKLFDMASGADMIADGVIIKVEDKFYYLRCLAGKGKTTTLKIQKYVGISGSFRFAKYEPGQRLFVFLKNVNGIYQLYSPGIEAEIPVMHDSLVVAMECFAPKTVESLAPKGLTPEYKKIQTFDVGTKKVFGLKFTPGYLYESIKAFNNCYQVILKKPNTYPSFNCFNFFDRYTRERINSAKQKSKLMKLLFLDMETTQVENCH